jgi:hypothetical protein
VACTQIAAFVHIPLTKRFAGNPDVTRFLGDNLGRILGYLLPVFFTNNYILIDSARGRRVNEN